MELWIVPLIILYAFLHMCQIVLLTNDVDPCQLWHFQEVTLQVLLTEVDLDFLNDILSAIKLPGHLFSLPLAPEEHVLIQLLV
jgi:hypothetical protein